MLSDGEANDPAGMPHDDRRLRTFVVTVQLFQPHTIGSQGLNDVHDAVMDTRQPLAKTVRSLAPNDASLDDGSFPGFDGDHSIAGDVEPGIDTENAN